MTLTLTLRALLDTRMKDGSHRNIFKSYCTHILKSYLKFLKSYCTHTQIYISAHMEWNSAVWALEMDVPRTARSVLTF